MVGRKSFITCVSILMLLLLSLVSPASNADVVNELLVLYSNNESAKNLMQFQADEIVFTKRLSPSWPLYNLVFKDSVHAYQAKQFYQQHKEIIAVQSNHRLSQRSTIPTDSLFNQQWYLHNIGFGPYLADNDIDAVEAWDSTTGAFNVRGQELVVAVVDVRFNLAHEDLNFFSNIHEPRNGFDDDGNGFIDDSLGWNPYLNNDDVNTTIASHATQISGIIGAKQNDTGIVGINWGVKILPVYSRAIESDVFEAFSYVLEMRKLYDISGGARGAFVIATNTSFGVDFALPDDYPIWCAIYDSLGYAGILNAAATANAAIDVDARGDIPTACASPFLITVTSTNGFDNLDANSAYGDTSIDVAAPGIGIFSTVAPNGYASGSGTSFAAPMVCGQIALMLSKACEKFWDMYDRDPLQSVEIIKSFILSSVDPLPGLNGKTVSGGRINLYKSILELNRFSCNECAVNPITSTQPPKCYNGTNGSAQLEILPSGSTASIRWSNGDTTQEASNLSAGQYQWFMTDSLGCIDSGRVIISNPSPLTFDSLETRDEIPSLKGYIYGEAKGGNPPYTYRVDTNSAFASPNLFLGLSADTFHFQVKDASGCIFDTLIILKFMSGLTDPYSNDGIKLVENPVTDFMSLQIPSAFAGTLMYKILNLNGQVLAEGSMELQTTADHLQILNVNALSNGLYLLTFSSGVKKFAPLKFIKSE